MPCDLITLNSEENYKLGVGNSLVFCVIIPIHGANIDLPCGFESEMDVTLDS